MIDFVLPHGSTMDGGEKRDKEEYQGIAREVQNMKMIVKLVIYGTLGAKLLERKSKGLDKRILDL